MTFVYTLDEQWNYSKVRPHWLRLSLSSFWTRWSRVRVPAVVYFNMVDCNPWVVEPGRAHSTSRVAGRRRGNEHRYIQSPYWNTLQRQLIMPDRRRAYKPVPAQFLVGLWSRVFQYGINKLGFCGNRIEWCVSTSLVIIWSRHIMVIMLDCLSEHEGSIPFETAKFALIV